MKKDRERKKNAVKGVTSTQISWILDHNDSQNIQNNEALILYTNRMRVLLFMVQTCSNHICLIPDGDLRRFRPGHRLECRIFELFGVSLSAGHKITRIASHTSQNHAPVMRMFSKSGYRNLGWSRPPWLGFPPKYFFPKTGMIFQWTCL